MVTKYDLVCSKVVLVRGTKRSCRSKKQKGRSVAVEMMKANNGIMLSVRVFYLVDHKTIKIVRHQEN